jgi:hypothetical protein
MKLNIPNKKGYTVIGLAVRHLHRKCIEHMLRHPAANRLHLDYCPGDRVSTVREIIKDIYPELQLLLPGTLKGSLDTSERNISLLDAIHLDKYEVFLKYLSPTNPNLWYGEPYHSSLLEIT